MPAPDKNGLEFEIEDPRKRAYLRALVMLGGHQGKAAAAVGLSRFTVRRWRAGRPERSQEPDPAYLDALARAEQLIGDRLEDEARRRAVEGITQYKFTKHGDPLLHPTMCEGGHALELHEHWAPDPDSSSSAGLPRPCLHPDCESAARPCEHFRGRPYIERVYSDKLLETLLRAQLPDKIRPEDAAPVDRREPGLRPAT